jgi:hypothetical protein
MPLPECRMKYQLLAREAACFRAQTNGYGREQDTTLLDATTHADGQGHNDSSLFVTSQRVSRIVGSIEQPLGAEDRSGRLNNLRVRRHGPDHAEYGEGGKRRRSLASPGWRLCIGRAMATHMPRLRRPAASVNARTLSYTH